MTRDTAGASAQGEVRHATRGGLAALKPSQRSGAGRPAARRPITPQARGSVAGSTSAVSPDSPGSLAERLSLPADLVENRVVSVEALVRWRHPVQGLLGPDELIHLAESSGLIDELTRQVLCKALQQCRRRRDEGLDLTMAGNISAHNVNNANLTDDVAS